MSGLEVEVIFYMRYFLWVIFLVFGCALNI